MFDLRIFDFVTNWK